MQSIIPPQSRDKLSAFYSRWNANAGLTSNQYMKPNRQSDIEQRDHDSPNSTDKLPKVLLESQAEPHCEGSKLPIDLEPQAENFHQLRTSQTYRDSPIHTPEEKSEMNREPEIQISEDEIRKAESVWHPTSNLPQSDICLQIESTRSPEIQETVGTIEFCPNDISQQNHHLPIHDCKFQEDELAGTDSTWTRKEGTQDLNFLPSLTLRQEDEKPLQEDNKRQGKKFKAPTIANSAITAQMTNRSKNVHQDASAWIHFPLPGETQPGFRKSVIQDSHWTEAEYTGACVAAVQEEIHLRWECCI